MVWTRDKELKYLKKRQDDFEQPLSTEVTLSVLPEPERVK